MKPAASSRDFLRAPSGRFLAGGAWLVFCQDSLAGFVLWGRPGFDDMRALVRVLPVKDSPLASSMRLLDIRRLETIDPAGLALLMDHVTAHAKEIAHLVRRAAVVHGNGLTAVLAAGFARATLEAPPAYALFTEVQPALAWLGGAPALEAELDRLQAQAAGVSPLLRDVRAALRAMLPNATLLSVAVRLGLSPRSLQRRLLQGGTSYQDELGAVRVEVAQKRLLESGATLDYIARELGFASASSFCKLFRLRTGDSPARWRAQSMGGPRFARIDERTTPPRTDG